MEINLEIFNRTIKCSSGESSLLIYEKESLNDFFDQRVKTRQVKLRDNVVCVACKEECNQFSSEDAYTRGGGGNPI